jgi:histidinol dehydrogenase
VIEYSRDAALAHADEIATLAACEGLDAHGRSALRRKEGK